MVRKPCRGKYQGHNDYSIVFGSGRMLFIGMDQRSYLNGLREQLIKVRYFREHQAENTAKIKSVLASCDTPFCDASVEIVPYPGTNDLFSYAAVLLTCQDGRKLVYRTGGMNDYLTRGETKWYSFEKCMAHLLQDAYGDMAYFKAYAPDPSPEVSRKHPTRKREELSR